LLCPFQQRHEFVWRVGEMSFPVQTDQGRIRALETEYVLKPVDLGARPRQQPLGPFGVGHIDQQTGISAQRRPLPLVQRRRAI